MAFVNSSKFLFYYFNFDFVMLLSLLVFLYLFHVSGFRFQCLVSPSLYHCIIVLHNVLLPFISLITYSCIEADPASASTGKHFGSTPVVFECPVVYKCLNVQFNINKTDVTYKVTSSFCQKFCFLIKARFSPLCLTIFQPKLDIIC